MREDFMRLLEALIDEFHADIGISDEEIIATLEAKVAERRKTIRRLEGAAS